MSGEHQKLNFKLENIKPHNTYFKLFVNNKQVGGKGQLELDKNFSVQLREYNIMLDKLWWLWNLLLFIPSFFGGCFIWDDVKCTQKIITLSLVSFSDKINIKIQNEESSIVVDGAEIQRLDTKYEENFLITKRAKLCKVILIVFAVTVLVAIALAIAITFILKK